MHFLRQFSPSLLLPLDVTSCNINNSLPIVKSIIQGTYVSRQGFQMFFTRANFCSAHCHTVQQYKISLLTDEGIVSHRIKQVNGGSQATTQASGPQIPPRHFPEQSAQPPHTAGYLHVFLPTPAVCHETDTHLLSPISLFAESCVHLILKVFPILL